VRILIFHGYLLRGTGSNVYNASLAQALVALGHEVHLLCQDRNARQLGFVDAVGEWSQGRLTVRNLRDPVRLTVYTPDIGRVLPVYVADAYDGFDAVPLPELDDARIEAYVAANVAAVAELAESLAPDVALANHLVLGPAILARALGGRVPYAVKVHGSALEYTVRPNPDRFLGWAREGLSGAGGVLVGSRHTAESLWEVLGDRQLPERTRLGPPGVDVEAFRPLAPTQAAERLTELADRIEAGAAAGWGGEEGAEAALRSVRPSDERVVAYVGKLIVSKGVDLLLAAWPLVVESVPDARLLVIGFGTYRGALGAIVDALAAGDLDAIRAIAARGRELEGGPAGELSHLAAFLDGLEGERRRRYVAAAPGAARSVVFTGRLEHADLSSVLPACSSIVVPSTFPEAFGMVAAEGAACGALPVSAAHSGLAEVTSELGAALAPEHRELLSFELGPGAVEELAGKLVRWLSRPAQERHRLAGQVAERARRRYGWEGVAEGVIAAAQGRLSGLAEPAPGNAASAPTTE
jgi:glycosyltransferase involved in cell wall biosynthesis